MLDELSRRRKLQAGLAGLALLIAGGAAGAAAIEATRPAIEMAPMRPVAIARLADTRGPVTLRGRVAETFGHMAVVQDDSGRALVDAGPRGDDGSLFAPGAAVTVQGRYDRGIVHASFLVDPRGEVIALAPPPPPPPPGHGPHGPPPGGPDAPPPPPAGAPPADGAAVGAPAR